MHDILVELQMESAQLEIEKAEEAALKAHERKRARLAEGKLKGMLMTIKHLTFANRDLTSENKELTQQCNKAMDERDAARVQNNEILLNSTRRSTTPMGPPPGTPPASATAHRIIPRTMAPGLMQFPSVIPRTPFFSSQ